MVVLLRLFLLWKVQCSLNLIFRDREYFSSFAWAREHQSAPKISIPWVDSAAGQNEPSTQTSEIDLWLINHSIKWSSVYVWQKIKNFQFPWVNLLWSTPFIWHHLFRAHQTVFLPCRNRLLPQMQSANGCNFNIQCVVVNQAKCTVVIQDERIRVWCREPSQTNPSVLSHAKPSAQVSSALYECVRILLWRTGSFFFQIGSHHYISAS